VPIEERYRLTPDFFAKKENVELAFQRSMAYPYQTKAEAIGLLAAGRQGHPARAPRGHTRWPRLLPRARRSVQPHAAALPEVGALDVALGAATALGNGGHRLNVSRGT
jgi:hypothetical protein